jgi:hypothetical protein
LASKTRCQISREHDAHPKQWSQNGRTSEPLLCGILISEPTSPTMLVLNVTFFPTTRTYKYTKVDHPSFIFLDGSQLIMSDDM